MRQFFLALIMLSLAFSHSFAQETTSLQKGPSADTLRKELPNHLRKLEERFAQLSGTSTIIDSLDYDRVSEKTKAKWKLAPGEELPKGEKTTGKFHVTFAVTDKFSKCDVTSDMEGVIGTVAGVERAKPPYRNVFSIGPRGCFTLLWKTSSSDVEVTTFSLTGEREKPRIQSLVRFAINSTYTLPLNKKLADLLADDQFSINKVDRVVVDGHDCYQVDFAYIQQYTKVEDKKKKSAETEIRGNFVVDPSFGWALRSWDYSSAEISRRNARKIDYTGEANGSFLPSEVVSTSEGSRTQRYRFDSLSLGAVDEKLFTLTYYGLPELDRPIGEVVDNSLAIWLGAAALLALTISIFFWVKSRRASN